MLVVVTQLYLDGGFTNGFWLVSGVCAAGVLLVLLMPRTARLDDADTPETPVTR